MGYGSGSAVGYLSEDVIGIGGANARVTFAEVTDEPGFTFDVAFFDGICGMAFQSISVDGVTPVWDALVNQGVVAKKAFGFYRRDDARGCGQLQVPPSPPDDPSYRRELLAREGPQGHARQYERWCVRCRHRHWHVPPCVQPRVC